MCKGKTTQRVSARLNPTLTSQSRTSSSLRASPQKRDWQRWLFPVQTKKQNWGSRADRSVVEVHRCCRFMRRTNPCLNALIATQITYQLLAIVRATRGPAGNWKIDRRRADMRERKTGERRAASGSASEMQNSKLQRLKVKSHVQTGPHSSVTADLIPQED